MVEEKKLTRESILDRVFGPTMNDLLRGSSTFRRRLDRVRKTSKSRRQEKMA